MEKPHRFERLDSSVRIAKRVGSVLRLFDDRAVKLNQQDTNAQIRPARVAQHSQHSPQPDTRGREGCRRVSDPKSSDAKTGGSARQLAARAARLRPPGSGCSPCDGSPSPPAGMVRVRAVHPRERDLGPLADNSVGVIIPFVNVFQT